MRWTSPGYGDSVSTAEPSIERLVDMVEAFVDDLTADRVCMVGNCVGSAVSILFAERRPEKVSSLTLFNPATASTLRPTALGLLARIAARKHFPRGMSRRVRVPSLSAKAMVWFQTGSGRVDPSNTELATRLRRLWTDKGRLQPLAEIAPNLRTPFEHIDEMSAEALSGIPAQMVWGERNRVLSAPAGRRLADRLGVPYIGLPEAGHLAMLEVPREQINDLLTESLAHV